MSHVAVTGGGSVGKRGRLSQPSWLLVHYFNTYLVTLRAKESTNIIAQFATRLVNKLQ